MFSYVVFLVVGFDVGLEMCGFQAGFELMFDKMNVGGGYALLCLDRDAFLLC